MDDKFFAYVRCKFFANSKAPVNHTREDAVDWSNQSIFVKWIQF